MAGYGLNQNENISSALATKFSLEETTVLIINASVSGNTSSNGLARLDWSLEDKPNIVILRLVSQGCDQSKKRLFPGTMQ